MIDSIPFHCVLAISPFVPSVYFLTAGPLSIRVTHTMYVSDYPILSVWFNPFSWSAVDRAFWFGLYTLFVPEALALLVLLDAVGVYLQFNLIDLCGLNVDRSP